MSSNPQRDPRNNQIGSGLIQLGTAGVILAVLLWVFNDVLLQLVEGFFLFVLVPLCLLGSVLGMGDGALKFARWAGYNGIPRLRKSISSWYASMENHMDGDTTQRINLR